MRKMLMILAVLSLVAVPALAQATPQPTEPATQAAQAPAPASDTAPSATPTTDALDLNDILNANQPIQTAYPYCGSLDGQPCSGGYARCQWTPYEPDICICSEGTYHCG